MHVIIHDFVGLHEAKPSLEDTPEDPPQDQQSYNDFPQLWKPSWFQSGRLHRSQELPGATKPRPCHADAFQIWRSVIDCLGNMFVFFSTFVWK